MIFKYIGAREGGLDRLKGRTVGFVHLAGSFGREPLPLLAQLAAGFGFAVKTYPLRAGTAQDPPAQWQAVRRDRPDWTILWGAGVAGAVSEAVKADYPMDRLIGVWPGGGEDDVLPAGPGAKGYLALNFTAVGAGLPAILDIRRYAAGRGAGGAPAGDEVGGANYNKGVYSAVLIAEAIRNAQRLSGRRRRRTEPCDKAS